MGHDAVVLQRRGDACALDPRDARVEQLEAELQTARTGLRAKLDELNLAREQLAALGDELGVSRVEQRVFHDERNAVNRELDHVRQELGHTQADHAQLVAVLSHELRNPLMLIGCGLEILEHAEPGSEIARRALVVLRRQHGYMSCLIEDLLDVSRVRHGKIRLRREPVDLGELVRRTVEDHRDAFDAAGIALELTAAPGPLSIQGDPTRLHQVLGNLLHNATKFTPRGGMVTVSAVADAVLPRAVLRVQDTGHGIDPAMLPRVFEPFLQADTAIEQSRGGLGLGLAVVRGVIEAHGGAISAESEGHGRGAAFTISLPLTAG